MASRKLESWSPWILLVATLVLWQAVCSAEIGRASCRERV